MAESIDRGQRDEVTFRQVLVRQSCFSPAAAAFVGGIFLSKTGSCSQRMHFPGQIAHYAGIGGART